MSKFKIGDHVRVTQPTACWFDQTGVVAYLEPGGKYPVFVDLDNGGQVAFRESELILADVVEDAGIDHGADCPWCEPEPLISLDGPNSWSIPQRHYVGLDPEGIKAADLVAANNAEFVAKMNAAAESVEHPAHYGGDTTYETTKVIEAWGLGFGIGNCVKYLSRAGKKGAAVEDLKKARFYLDREIARMESDA